VHSPVDASNTPQEVQDISVTANEVVGRWVNPLTGGKEETNGLVYGLVQSGKTGVLTVTGAMGADEGYRTIIILTSDNDALYDQTMGRVREAFPGILLDIPERQDAMRGIIVECHRSGESWVAVDADGAVVGFVLVGPDFHDQKAISLRYIGVSGNSRRRGNTCHPDEKLKAKRCRQLRACYVTIAPPWQIA
jgi:hypothetical protein